MLEAIDKMDGEVVVVLRDFHQCWHGQPRIIRKLRNLAQKLKYTRWPATYGNGVRTGTRVGPIHGTRPET